MIITPPNHSEQHCKKSLTVVLWTWKGYIGTYPPLSQDRQAF